MRARAAFFHWQPAMQTGLTLMLCGLSLLALAQSFHAARWVPQDAPVLTAFGLGLVCGWALACSRWRGWSAAVYSLIVSLAAASQALGGVMQLRGMLAAPGFWQAVDLLNLRGLAFYYRANGWFSAALNGQRVEDTGFFIFLAALLAWNTSVWLVWWVERKKAALPGILLGGALLAVNTHLSKQNAAFLLLYLLGAVLLLARTALLNRYVDWDRRSVDYPYDLGLDWGGTAAGLALVIALTAWGLGLVGTPQAWRSMSDWLEKTRQQTSETAERLFPNVNPPRQDLDVIIAETPNLSEIGAPLPRGKSTIMTIRLNDPEPPPPDNPASGTQPPVHYWRSQIFDEYTGRGWQPVFETSADQSGVPQNSPLPGRYALEQQITILAAHGDTLFAASQPVSASPAVRLMAAGADGSLLLSGSADEYQVTSFAPDVSANALRAASTDYPAEISATYLQLPDSLPQRVRALAERITDGAQTTYDQAQRIQIYLRQNFGYDLTAGPAPEGTDVVDDFLFRTQSGFCSHFASAMAVMLRSRGIPARVVGGYAMGTFDYDQRAYRVPADAAHAWVEVYFPGYGWIEFEPTAEVGTISYPEAGTGAITPDLKSPPSQPSRLDIWLLAAAGFAATGVLLLLAIRRAGRRKRTALGQQSSAFYRRVRRSLGGLGLSAPPTVTPREFLFQQRTALQDAPRIHAALQAATALHEQAAYSPRPPQADAYRSACQAWDQSRPERCRFAWLRVRARLRLVGNK